MQQTALHLKFIIPGKKRCRFLRAMTLLTVQQNFIKHRKTGVRDRGRKGEGAERMDDY